MTGFSDVAASCMGVLGCDGVGGVVGAAELLPVVAIGLVAYGRLRARWSP